MSVHPVFLFDAGPEDAPCALVVVESVCRMASGSAATRGLLACGLTDLAAAVRTVSDALAAFSEQEWLAEGGLPALPFSPALPGLVTLGGVVGTLPDAIQAMQWMDDPVECGLFALMRQLRLLDRSGVLDDLPLTPADYRCVAMAVARVMDADRGGRRKPLPPDAPVHPSANLDAALDYLQSALADVLPLLIAEAIPQAGQRDQAVVSAVLQGTARVAGADVVALA